MNISKSCWLCPALVLLMLGTLPAQAQVVYKCSNAKGVVAFSDKECATTGAKLNVKAPVDADMVQQKADHDAKVARDRALAEQIEASRLSSEQAGRALQDQQMLVNRAQADRVEQERNQINSTVLSSPNVTQPAPVLTAP